MSQSTETNIPVLLFSASCHQRRAAFFSPRNKSKRKEIIQLCKNYSRMLEFTESHLTNPMLEISSVWPLSSQPPLSSFYFLYSTVECAALMKNCHWFAIVMCNFAFRNGHSSRETNILRTLPSFLILPKLKMDITADRPPDHLSKNHLGWSWNGWENSRCRNGN